MAITSPRAAARQLLVVPEYWEPKTVEDIAEWTRQIAHTVNLLLDGKSNALGSVTLGASSTTTTLNDRRIGVDSIIAFMPTTANAKDEGTPYVTARGAGTCTLNHVSNSQNDRSYDYAILG